MAQTSLPIFEPYIERVLENGIVQACFAVSEEQFCTIKSHLAQNILCFSSIPNLEKVFSQIEIRANCFEIRKCLGCTNVQVLSWHTFLSPADISADKELQKGILETLSKEVGLNFRNEYAGLCGAFEVCHMPEWSEDAEPPFSLSLRGPGEKPMELNQRDSLVFRRRADFAQNQHYLSLKLYAGESLIYDKMHILEAGLLQLGPITTEEHFNRESYSLYDEQGNLVHEEDFPLLDSIGLGIFLGGPTVRLDGDKVSQQANSLGNNLAERATTVQTKSMPENSVITFSNTGSIRQHLYKQKWDASSLFEKERNSAWFENGNEESIESLLHIISIICEYNSKNVLLMDPFFDKTAFVDLIPRISTRMLPITILTNLFPRGDKAEGTIVDDWAELCDSAERNKRLIHCNLTIYNIRLAGDLIRRSFHDRYLVIHKGEQNIDTHLLSNSINSRSRNFPFCMSKLDNSVSMRIKSYIESMLAPDSKKFDISQVWKNYE